MPLIHLDLETTDLDENARIVQLAYKNTDTNTTVNEYFKPPVPISFGAMATHHITSQMVADKPAFDGSPQKNDLITLLENNILVAHNALFDIGVLKTEGVTTSKYIDTLRVARHLIESESYQLQYLRYSLDLNVEAPAHDALGDIQVLEKLFDRLVGLVDDDMDRAIEKLLELTNTPVLLKTINFGKHKGKTFTEIAATDKGYLQWLFNEKSKNPTDQDEDMIYTLRSCL